MIEIVGDGLAGVMLATELPPDKVVLRGDGRSHTPPLGLVHLYAGRTFRRDELEVEAFRRACKYWSNEPLATETTVLRRFEPGDRLARSLDDAPEDYRPEPVGPNTVRYGPAYVVQAQDWRETLLERLGSAYREERVDLSTPSEAAVRVVATGFELPQTLPEVDWDLSHGDCVRGAVSSPIPEIVIGGGCHIAGYPSRSQVQLGGNPEPEVASQELGQEVKEVTRWSGSRCANAEDRRPVLGWLDERTFVFGSFGSRALFWLPFCVWHAMFAIAKGTDDFLPEPLRLSRLAQGVR